MLPSDNRQCHYVVFLCVMIIGHTACKHILNLMEKFLADLLKFLGVDCQLSEECACAHGDHKVGCMIDNIIDERGHEEVTTVED